MFYKKNCICKSNIYNAIRNLINLSLLQVGIKKDNSVSKYKKKSYLHMILEIITDFIDLLL